MSKGVRAGGRSRARGFNVVELLVVVAVIAILAAVLLPAWMRSKQQRIQAGCLSNLKQLARALQVYVDDYEDQLPGPVWNGMLASADANASEQLLHYVAPYLGMPPLGDEAVVIPAAACPGYMNAAPGIHSIRDMEGRISYLLNPDVDPLPGAPVRPFGYPDPEQGPLKRSDLSRYGSPADLYAISDTDKGNVTDPSIDWRADLPAKPVHRGERNQIFFDWHVSAVRATTDTLKK